MNGHLHTPVLLRPTPVKIAVGTQWVESGVGPKRFSAATCMVFNHSLQTAEAEECLLKAEPSPCS